jgi:cytochrome c oxidase cbb3-type subunit 4
VNYEAIRQFADSYGLGAMVVAYLLFAGWALRPGARAHHEAAAAMIFAEDAAPENPDRNSSHG